MAEGARLESVFTRKGNVGSNPTLSARLLKIKYLLEFMDPLSGSLFVFGMSHMHFWKAQLRAVKVKPTANRFIQADLWVLRAVPIRITSGWPTIHQWRVVVDATFGRERSCRNIEPTSGRWDESRKRPLRVGGVHTGIVLLCSTLGVTGASKSPSLGGAGHGPNHFH